MTIDGFKEDKGNISLSKKNRLCKKLKVIDKNKTISELEEKQNSREIIIKSNNIKLKEKI